MTQVEAEISAGISNVQLLDARPEKVFSEGHITNAHNLFFKTLVNEDNTVKNKEEILAILKSL